MKPLVFSVDELYKCTTQSERRNFRLTKEIFEEKTRSLMQSLSEGNCVFAFSKKGEIYANSKTDKFESLFQDLILRKIYKNIKVVYKLSQADRDKIISQIKILLEETKPYWVLKLDIKSFYESINRNEIVQNLKRDYLLNRQTFDLMEKIFANPIFSSITGVPRGLCISSIMSEIYMKQFDLEVKRINGVYYYARFVDDIILFCNSSSARDDAEKKICSLLNNLKLSLNSKKVQKWDIESNNNFTYLGYAFSHDDNNNGKLIISIARNKIDKIKTRIVKSFISYTKKHDFQMLRKRIKFLSGNIVLNRKNSLSPIFVGIFYNYKKINNKGSLKTIDDFYQKILNSKKGKLGAKLHSLLNSSQLNELKKYSFTFGHEHKVRHYFSVDDMKKIARCWR